MEVYDRKTSGEWLVCNACTTQFPTSDRSSLKTCFICDDPRQYIPPSGQSFTTLNDIVNKHHNEFAPFKSDERLISITTTPKLGIGQRAILVKTPAGNVLWDCVALLDENTIARIKDLGGLKAIVISHPHYYSTHVQWARAFQCPVYLASDDVQWTALRSRHQVLLTSTETEVVDGSGFLAIKLGGHFPGSLVGLFDGRLLIADTLMTTPAGIGRWEADATGAARAKPPGLNSFSFMWSIPNMIPLSASELARMWEILKAYEFRSTHGAFVGMDIEDAGVKGRVLDSMKIQASYMGYTSHALLNEAV
ncbi:metallo-beta-lactamase family protein [Stachybotrys elegans]|uniref:Metallo-beta-lactamase family protein n=1 Tax=Stachybotrys elegans TaxID=80388 RepID=A0A8K0WME7_9HYPO|nr:metallo-beta-lactamase family protein [Stachybotrys elegans]